MPFDGDLPLPRAVVFERLNILYELCRRTDAPQNDWNTCLWADATRDPRLLAHGIWDDEDTPAFFGLTDEDAEVVFGAQYPAQKLSVIKAALWRLVHGNYTTANENGSLSVTPIRRNLSSA